jgi:peptidoglycan LD-endopeptidase LytH
MCGCHSLEEHPLAEHPLADHRRLNRRSALVGLAATAGALVFGGGSRATAQTASGELDEPGSALERADRLSQRRLPVEPPPAGKLIFPVQPAGDCYVLDNFGACRSGGTRAHAGVDILGSRGAPIFAVANGRLVTRYTNTGEAGWGWSLLDPTTNTTYKYFHMAEDPNGRTLDQQVVLGDILGYVGNSGTYGVDNYHLHFEVRPNNVPVDPLPFLFYDRVKIPTAPPDKGCVGKPMY